MTNWNHSQRFVYQATLVVFYEKNDILPVVLGSKIRSMLVESTVKLKSGHVISLLKISHQPPISPKTHSGLCNLARWSPFPFDLICCHSPQPLASFISASQDELLLLCLDACRTSAQEALCLDVHQSSCLLLSLPLGSCWRVVTSSWTSLAALSVIKTIPFLLPCIIYLFLLSNYY